MFLIQINKEKDKDILTFTIKEILMALCIMELVIKINTKVNMDMIITIQIQTKLHLTAMEHLTSIKEDITI
jgi:hypothetical protein